MTGLIVFLSFFGYIIIGIVVAMTLISYFVKKHGKIDTVRHDDDLSIIFISIFWPIGIPIFSVSVFLSWWYEKMKDINSDDK